MSDEKTLALLDEHKKLMILSGRLSDFQIKNLEMFPKVIFDKLAEATCKYDLDLKGGKGTVTYSLTTKGTQDNLIKRKRDLGECVKQLLFEEVKVKIRIRKT